MFQGGVVTNKLQLVEFILGHMHANELNTVAHLISPDFEYKSDFQKNMTFDQYCQYITVSSQTFELSVQRIERVDDVFTASVTFNVVDNTMKYYSKIPAKAVFVVTENLLSSIKVDYEATEADLAYIKSLNLPQE